MTAAPHRVRLDASFDQRAPGLELTPEDAQTSGQVFAAKVGTYRNHPRVQGPAVHILRACINSGSFSGWS